MNKMPLRYPIRAAALATGIPVDTLRAWERRYRAVTPTRAGGARVYEEADIQRLVLLRRAVESGRSIGQVANLSDAELRRLVRRERPAEARPYGEHVELQPLLDYVQAYDYAATNHELGRLALLLRPTELVYRVVLPLMRYAGESWENGTMQVAHEHMVSACMRNLLGGLLRLPNTDGRAGRMLLTTPSGELHEFGVLAAAMLAAAHGFAADYLGPNLPAREVLFAAEKCAPRVVVLGIVKVNLTAAARADIRRLTRELSPTTELWIGGTGAAEVSSGPAGHGPLKLADLEMFERHAVRVAAAPASH